MPKINFQGVEDAIDYSPLPDDSYPCQLTDVEIDTTRHGDEMWKLRFTVEEGAYAGRYIFDNMVFSDAAMKRVKLICSSLGLDTGGELNLTPELVKGRPCVVTVSIEEYLDNHRQTKWRNFVPFTGYQPAVAKSSGEGGDDGSDLPF